MSNYPTAQVNILYTRQNRFLSKTLLFFLAILSTAFSSMTNAQTSPPSSSNTAPNSFSSQPNDIRPIQQPGSFFDSNNGSRQFFQQGREQLYFLPEEKSEPILQIEEDVRDEAEEEKGAENPKETDNQE